MFIKMNSHSENQEWIRGRSHAKTVGAEHGGAIPFTSIVYRSAIIHRCFWIGDDGNLM